MPEMPDCLHRRYQALDELIRELTATSSQGSQEDCLDEKNTNDPGIKLMCDFWNILKEDPECNLSQAVKQRMGLHNTTSSVQPEVTCFLASRSNKKFSQTCSDESNKCANRKVTMNKAQKPCSHASKSGRMTCASSTSRARFESPDMLPLSKVLCNLKEAASFEKRCNSRVNELMNTQKDLKVQIIQLEQREKEGIKLLKQADCMWSCMEESYKKKIAESLQKQKELLKELKEVEASNAKWRKNQKDLECQMSIISRGHQEIIDKIAEKNNDMKCMDLEIGDFKRRIESNKAITDGAKKVVSNKKQASDAKIANIAAEVTKLTKALTEAEKQKRNKEYEGQNYVRDAREDLRKICKVLLRKKLENEELLSEREALRTEINLIQQSCDQCQEKCKCKQDSIEEEIKKIDQEIADFKLKCERCHEATDTTDARKFCTDCPRCKEDRDCLIAGDHCENNSAMDCVCMSVKEKFLDNVFDNMNTVLEKHSNTESGKAVADAVLKCLKNSRNGKLNKETKRLLQEFVLTTVKKNLNLTIVGGAVKTRCEMDPDTYKQLMLCLQQVKAVKPPKADKGTAAKKESCSRWGGASECNCPGGPKACTCTKRAPPPLKDPSLYPSVCVKEEAFEELPPTTCPLPVCGPDCRTIAPNAVATDVAAIKPESCSGSTCPFTKNMRAAQCVLGPEWLKSPTTCISHVPEKLSCRCAKCPTSCVCKIDRTNRPRESIIRDVLGRYAGIMPIEKVSCPTITDVYDDYSQISFDYELKT